MNSNSEKLYNDYEQVHRERFGLSLEWVRPHLTDTSEVLDFGGMSPFYEMLKPFVKYLGVTDHDLRYPHTMPPNKWDAALCMEVLEHIGDKNTKHGQFNSGWRGDGASTMLSEAFRILKPGGILFLTTPNAASITAIKHVLHHAPPMIYRPHVREYVPYELDELVRAAGFMIERRETLDVWLNAITPQAHNQISLFIAEGGYERALRGEDIFLLARKPILETPKAEAK